MSIELQLRVAGVLLILLAVSHAGFPRYFLWRKELASLSRVNREIMQVHTLFVAVTVGLIGLLAVSSAPLLCTTGLGRRVAGGIAAFWLLRLIVQLFGYSTELWRGKRFETAAHVIFVFFWGYLSAIFAWCALSG